MQALEFLVHFVGDITQPLHDEAYEVGGNDVDVTYQGTYILLKSPNIACCFRIRETFPQKLV